MMTFIVIISELVVKIQVFFNYTLIVLLYIYFFLY